MRAAEILVTKFRRLKLALKFCVINYGLKSIMRAGVQACKCASDLWNEANTVYCFVVPPSQISCHWFQPVVDDEFDERRIYSAFGRANLQVSPNLSRSADLPTSRLANSFGSAEASPSQFIPSLVPRPTPRFKSVTMKTKPAEAG